ncbi:ROK family transcriptional regulator [Planctomonas psychrotolerans]|uniref:ROK family transcriptional regulator n=1 Tax=Planctomonas psychrotolerans TaxID=2528712 RepID=UPI00123B39F4|nr:ROK family transcriptional regulator [Planctomonas psychrotolerans]
MSTAAAPQRPLTHGVVLDLIRAARRISRVELVDASGLTGATITNVVRDLIDEGLVEEAGHAESTGGKRRTLLRLRARARFTVGVQLDRSSCTIVIIDLAGQLVARTAIGGAGYRSPHETLCMVADHVDSLLDSAGVDRHRVLGIGLVSHGPQNLDDGRLLSLSPMPQWHGFPIVADLEQITGLPVLLDNDATAAAIGEFWIGGVDPASTYACIYMASGIGGGVVSGGGVYRGGTSNSVEIGHVSLDINGPECSCGNRGCLEDYAGPPAVIAKAHTVPGLAERLRFTAGETETLTNFARIARAAVAGDADALTLIRDSARYMAHSAISLTSLFDLDAVVLAGQSFATAGSIYVEAMQAELDRAGFARDVHPVRVTLSKSGADAAAIGGAVLVLRSEYTPRDLRRPDGRSLRYGSSRATALPLTAPS